MWFAEFGIDGIRFDAADSIDHGFLREMAAVCRKANPDCWLMGEVVHGDYREWAGEGMLDSCTNYECFKGLYSSFNDRNMYEIAWSLNRQFGPQGIYRDLRLYSFADNHDVNRVASLLDRGGDLSSLYSLLFTIPGVPSIYYGSEWGIPGEKHGGNDASLRPPFSWPVSVDRIPEPWLAPHIALLAKIRADEPALRHGDYAQLHVDSEQLAFVRRAQSDAAVVIVNANGDEVALELTGDIPDGTVLIDRLDPSVSTTVQGGKIEVKLAPNSARVLTGRIA
jgi:glycosidase